MDKIVIELSRVDGKNIAYIYPINSQGTEQPGNKYVYSDLTELKEAIDSYVDNVVAPSVVESLPKQVEYTFEELGVDVDCEDNECDLLDAIDEKLYGKYGYTCTYNYKFKKDKVIVFNIDWNIK